MKFNKIKTFIKIIINLSNKQLPEYYKNKKYYISSQEGGFIHIVSGNNYLNICKTLLTIKIQRCIGITFVKEEEDYLMDWCFLDSDWQYDSAIKESLKNFYPFRPVQEKLIPSYQFE